MRLEDRLERVQVDVALERVLHLRLKSLGYRAIDGVGLARLDVALGGIEMAVARHDFASADFSDSYEGAEQHVLRGAPLVAGQEMRKAE